MRVRGDARSMVGNAAVKFDPNSLSPTDLGTWAELQRTAGGLPAVIEKGWLDDHLGSIINAVACRTRVVQSEPTIKKRRPRPQKKAP